MESADIGCPPMAYTSLKELAAAIAPNVYGSSTIGVKKSTCLHQREVRGDPEHTGIVAGIETHQNVGMLHASQARERLVQNLWTQLRRSTGGFDVRGQLLAVHQNQNTCYASPYAISVLFVDRAVALRAAAAACGSVQDQSGRSEDHAHSPCEPHDRSRRKGDHVDPWSQGNYEALPKADIILITDIHGDHMDPKAIAAIRKEGTQIVAPAAVATKVTGATSIANGNTSTVGEFAFQAVPMYNEKRGPEPGKLFHDKGRGERIRHHVRRPANLRRRRYGRSRRDAGAEEH
jgi:hypothetical protein